MSDKPRLSVLVAWCERDELALTLVRNTPFFRGQEAEVLVLNCSGNSDRLQDLIAPSALARVRQLDIAAARFNKSLALNIGLAHSRAETIFVLDADIVMLEGGLPEAGPLLEDHSFLTIEWVYESDAFPAVPGAQADTLKPGAVRTPPPEMQFCFRDGTIVRHRVSRRDRFGNREAPPGLLLANKSDLLQIQGYNSKLQGWGWEDDDVLVRLQYKLGLKRILRGTALHLSHGDDRRAFEESQGRSKQLNFLRSCRDYNHGRFLGTYDSDVAWALNNVVDRRQAWR